jgi:hypothetical protein
MKKSMIGLVVCMLVLPSVSLLACADLTNEAKYIIIDNTDYSGKEMAFVVINMGTTDETNVPWLITYQLFPGSGGLSTKSVSGEIPYLAADGYAVIKTGQIFGCKLRTDVTVTVGSDTTAVFTKHILGLWARPLKYLPYTGPYIDPVNRNIDAKFISGDSDDTIKIQITNTGTTSIYNQHWDITISQPSARFEGLLGKVWFHSTIRRTEGVITTLGPGESMILESSPYNTTIPLYLRSCEVLVYVDGCFVARDYRDIVDNQFVKPDYLYFYMWFPVRGTYMYKTFIQPIVYDIMDFIESHMHHP